MAYYKIIVTVPVSHADAVREAIGAADGGKIGKYSFCSFSVKGIGRFKPEEGANPHIGSAGKLEEVEEERIEITCHESVVGNVKAAIERVHPYEEIVMDIWPLSGW